MISKCRETAVSGPKDGAGVGQLATELLLNPMCVQVATGDWASLEVSSGSTGSSRKGKVKFEATAQRESGNMHRGWHLPLHAAAAARQK